ncbi:MAG TPA: GNAT family N-acetyltransferase [Gaiellales bacterium]
MTGPDRDDLRAAAAANHVSWFARCAEASGGRAVRRGKLDVAIDGARHGTLAFPARTHVRDEIDGLLADAGTLGVRSIACWSLDEDRALGTILMARGFEIGWQPHWMALDLAAGGQEPTRRVEPAGPPYAADLPYVSAFPYAAEARHLAVRDTDEVVGHVVVNPWQGIAGIYEMGVVPALRRQGIGRALMDGAAGVARELGCTHAVLNATLEGELLYRAVGFESLGKGRTWWLHPGRHPSARQTELVEAIGYGDLERLASLGPTDDELDESVPGAGKPLEVAVVTGQVQIAAWILDRRPELTSRPLAARGPTLLHTAVEWDDIELARMLLARGADTAVRDGTWDGTPLGWATHLGNARLAELLRAHSAQ